MKKEMVFFIALLCIILTASVCTKKNVIDTTDQMVQERKESDSSVSVTLIEDKNIIKTNIKDDLGFQLEFPKEWEGKFVIETNEEQVILGQDIAYEIYISLNGWMNRREEAQSGLLMKISSVPKDELKDYIRLDYNKQREEYLGEGKSYYYFAQIYGFSEAQVNRSLSSYETMTTDALRNIVMKAFETLGEGKYELGEELPFVPPISTAKEAVELDSMIDANYSPPKAVVVPGAYIDCYFDSSDYHIKIPCEWEGRYHFTKSYHVLYDDVNQDIVELTAVMDGVVDDKGVSQYKELFKIITVPKDQIAAYVHWSFDREREDYIGLGKGIYYFVRYGGVDADNLKGNEYQYTDMEETVIRDMIEEGFQGLGEGLFTKHEPYPFIVPYITSIEQICNTFEYTDETGKKSIEEVADIFLKQLEEYLSTDHKEWKFAIYNCDAYVDEEGIIYSYHEIDSIRPWSRLSGRPKNDNQWIFLCSVSVYDYYGCVGTVCSDEFNRSGWGVVSEFGGTWVIEREDNHYRMFRPKGD
jgi:hypothetical protein